ncbi:IX [Egyptian fruit bat adenovirus]|uniref:IX n=1 Tax=Egyptian fruit bat adenovirus TaxID=2849732 RepID=A0A344X9U0_9ADEN|nr:IX [Rousettus aegyptiacus adenovirus]AXE75622.1 IX [Egyptian fruit bat adenovirus]
MASTPPGTVHTPYVTRNIPRWAGIVQDETGSAPDGSLIPATNFDPFRKPIDERLRKQVERLHALISDLELKISNIERILAAR